MILVQLFLKNEGCGCNIPSPPRENCLQTVLLEKFQIQLILTFGNLYIGIDILIYGGIEILMLIY